MKFRPVRLPGHRNHLNFRKEKGAVAILVALSLVVLIGFAGLALDLGKLYVAKTELQNAADACALAGAFELNSTDPNLLNLAEEAGTITGKNHHKVQFQANAVQVKSVKFSDKLDGTYQSAFVGSGANNMRYVRCEVEETGILNWLIQVLNVLPGASIGNSQTVNAIAVASPAPSQTFSCPISIGLCDNILPAKGTGSGTWIKTGLTVDNPGTGWVNFSGSGASSVEASLTGACTNTNIPALDTTVPKPGTTTSIASAWNTRFGLYFGNDKKGASVPDYSGYSYYPGYAGSTAATTNAYANYLTQKFVPYQIPIPTPPSKDPLDPSIAKKDGTSTAADHAKGDARRVGTIAVMNCSGGAPSKAIDWACVFMLHPIDAAKYTYIEYLGRASELNSPCAPTNGVPGGASGVGPLVPALVQ